MLLDDRFIVLGLALSLWTVLVLDHRSTELSLYNSVDGPYD